MKSTFYLIGGLVLTAFGVGMLYAAYSPPTDYQTVSGRVITNAGQEVELQVRQIDDKPNPTFVKYRNASSRLWLKDRDTFRILVEINGQILANTPLATGSVSCDADKRQPIYVRVRIEDPATEPTEAEFTGAP